MVEGVGREVLPAPLDVAVLLLSELQLLWGPLFLDDPWILHCRDLAPGAPTPGTPLYPSLARSYSSFGSQPEAHFLLGACPVHGSQSLQV